MRMNYVNMVKKRAGQPHISCVLNFFSRIVLFITAFNIDFTAFRRDVLSDHYRCVPGMTLFEIENTSTAVGCAKICYKNDFCYSFFYQEDVHVCFGCDGFYHHSERLPGSKYFGRFSGTCTPGWVAQSKSCYFFGSVKTTYTAAMMDCKRMGGHLVEIDEKTESRYIKSVTSSSAKLYFVGSLYNESGENTYNGSGKCKRTGIETGGYVGFDCDEQANYICERPRSVY